ncbi:SHOCT domain-containing protein [Natrononativus amylolyticus]|uniref:SHOCT domain-containing protein n=1 Tax=Natrononativus amylolyticus TaxID=2963434 RepID=UPI0020CC0442|nr:SHOCT domain-containing protein [Natrononativus amylolyticus]
MLPEILEVLAAFALLAVTFVGLFTGTLWLFVVGLVGMVCSVPLWALLVGDRETIEEWWGEERAEELTAEPSGADPLEAVKQRYAAGELSEAEFERELERLLEADDPAAGNGGRDRRESASVGRRDAPELETDER